jgi:hypothetical protein
MISFNFCYIGYLKCGFPYEFRRKCYVRPFSARLLSNWVYPVGLDNNNINKQLQSVGKYVIGI